MKAHIIYANFLKPNGIGLNIGGIETYIINLSEVLYTMGFNVNIYQRGDIKFETKYGYYNIIGVVNNNIHTFKYDIFNECIQRCNKLEDIIIFASEEFIVKKKGYKTIGIQHGISWDIPTIQKSSFNYFRIFLNKVFRAWIRIHRVNKVETMVCVDYNFINWYRALSAYPKTKLVAIPNFTIVPENEELNKKSTEFVDIIFARRFQPYRGTRIFAKAAKRILEEYQNVRITFAGEGPDEIYLKQLFENESRVSIFSYESSKSLEIHSSKHIAVVPTIGSEGTSLSLLEAMAARCAVIATNVGGMTNIVLDHYNGLLIDPDENSLYIAIKELLDKQILREYLAKKGYETVSNTFSIEKWKEMWEKIITEYKYVKI
ncbi:MAG: glycosyltransferase family 4 protein [Bacteroidales bacterium]|nr:glycosyltransferase family 4 protein [Bacteroidales bacterium]